MKINIENNIDEISKWKIVLEKDCYTKTEEIIKAGRMLDAIHFLYYTIDDYIEVDNYIAAALCTIKLHEVFLETGHKKDILNSYMLVKNAQSLFRKGHSGYNYDKFYDMYLDLINLVKDNKTKIKWYEETIAIFDMDNQYFYYIEMCNTFAEFLKTIGEDVLANLYFEKAKNKMEIFKSMRCYNSLNK